MHWDIKRNKILNMHVRSFAYNAARKNDWKTVAADRYRFDLRMQKFKAMLAEVGFFSKIID